MKRFFKTLCLLLAALLLLLSGVDSALDRLAVAPEQGAFTFYNKKGETLFSYRGDLAFCKLYTHSLRARFLPAHSGLAPRA
jgi:hypothetical protein